jgi:DNA-binding IclR family transcriptional regulator
MTTDKVLQTLKAEGKALKAAEIAEKAGIDKKEVDKALKELKASGKVIVPKNCFYQAK